VRNRMLLVCLALLVFVLAASPARASDKGEMDKIMERIHESEAVLRASANAPDKGIPRNLLEKAECIAVFPGLTKGAFVVGGEFGRGVATCRQKNGAMGAPAFFTIGGGSFGWQFGGQKADLVLLIMNENGVKRLLQDKFSLGGEASIAAGPVGRTAQAATDAQLHSEILSWSRSRGIFLGASLKGTVIKPDKDATTEYYNKPVTASDILVAQSVPAPANAQSFMRTATELSKRSS
jgi:lipid-binding SYLF domain-containing protein